MCKKYITSTLSEAKKLIINGEKEKGGFNLLRVFRGTPRNKALIKYLSEEGIRAYYKKLKTTIKDQKQGNA